MLSKGNNDELQIFKNVDAISENLWCHTFLIVFNKQTQNIEIYQVDKMKLYQILPFHYFDVEYLKWDQEQSSFIAFDDYGSYCVFERVYSNVKMFNCH